MRFLSLRIYSLNSAAIAGMLSKIGTLTNIFSGDSFVKKVFEQVGPSLSVLPAPIQDPTRSLVGGFSRSFFSVSNILTTLVGGLGILSLFTGGFQGWNLKNIFGRMGFRSGGYTGTGALSEVAGVVHKGEYVIPNWMVESILVLFLS